MVNTNKQINYWMSNAKNDIKTAELLIKENKILHGLFFCHLVIEKAIKACVVKTTDDIAPLSHNLIFLSEKANIRFKNEQEIFLGILMKYQLEGRYPDYNPSIPNSEISLQYLEQTNELLQWIENQL